ncbi:MAG TPA: AAA family ATPase, partial [Victivallales bacterium]|nr:AAA family ATPase [Victivallales bacterium]
MNEKKVENEITQSDVEKINKIRDNYSKLKNEIAKVIYGQDDVIEKILICIFSGGHALLMGVPGLAKTLTINTIAKTMNLSFSRIQFTPDLMPSDIIGTEILQEDYNEGKRFLQFIKGPVFANVILADEINRTPPKTQAALLQAMQEKSITVAGKTYELVKPFFVLATQNPIEQEGTYPLPEAQLDRFMFFIKVNYPDKEHELMIAKSNPSPLVNNIKHIISSEELIEYQELIKKIPVPEHIYDYVVRIVRETRPPLPEAPKWLKSLVNWGA